MILGLLYGPGAYDRCGRPPSEKWKSCILIVEGYRPLAVQRNVSEPYWNGLRGEMKSAHERVPEGGVALEGSETWAPRGV